MTIELYNADNLSILDTLYVQSRDVAVVYADCIYESKDFTWVDLALKTLKKDGVIIIQTDYHTAAEYKLFLDSKGLTFINWCIYKQEWGGVSNRYFPRKHDDILIYSNGKDYNFFYNKILIPKKTAGTAFDKKGTGLKIPCDVFDDLGNFSTVSKERIKTDDKKNIKWQKPLKLMERLLLPFTNEGDTILDPFMGSGTTGIWCILNKRNFIGIEIDMNIYNIAQQRLAKSKEK